MEVDITKFKVYFASYKFVANSFEITSITLIWRFV